MPDYQLLNPKWCQTQEEEDFFKAFGSFSDNKSAEEIIRELKNQRNFKTKDITFS